MVRIERDPEVESRIVALIRKNDRRPKTFLNPADDKKCFLCGNTKLATGINQGLGRRYYLGQVDAFKKLLRARALINEGEGGICEGELPAGQESCDKCLKTIDKVYWMRQEVEAIEKEIREVLVKVADESLRSARGSSLGKMTICCLS